MSAAFDSAGNATFQPLYTPYGSVRYSNGASPTALGYTGQQADSATGLDYCHARYYDPVAQLFVSADTMSDGLSRYGYAGGNPTTNFDMSFFAQGFLQLIQTGINAYTWDEDTLKGESVSYYCNHGGSCGRH